MPWENKSIYGWVRQELYNMPKPLDGENNFLYQSLIEFAKVSTQAFDNIGDYLFSYKEKQLSAIFLPAFYNLGYGVMQEAPTRRKKRGETYTHAWLDYWVQKDDETVFLVEVKHSWQYFGGILKKDAISKINSSVDQLKHIRKQDVRNLSLANETVKLSLLVLPIYRNVPLDSNLKEDEEFMTERNEIDDMLSYLSQEMPSSISWMGVWLLPKRMQYTFQSNEINGLRTFPGVIILSCIIT
ncbi:hypothetical protein [Desulfonatronospira sp.]|uniref:hypothetical protein n=1 Tax=Desulfonatronospira sp. TaxID=1962951 RepID=UPI0025BDE7DA|nr:hypothetical protein [Desulfonatronospira sp.]